MTCGLQIQWFLGIILFLLGAILLLIVNVVKRRRVERELNILNNSLEDKVQSRTISLQEREAELASIFRSSYAGIGVIKEQMFVKVNPRFCAMIGYSEAELVGKSSLMIYPSAADFKKIGEYVSHRLKKFNNCAFTSKFMHKDGHLVDVIGTVSPLNLDDQAQGLAFTVLDVTEIKEIESKLSKSEHRFRLMMESMIDPVYICSEDYRVEYMNPAMRKRVGSDKLGEHCYKTIHGLSRRCPWCQNRLENRNEFFEFDISVPHDRHSYHVSMSPIVESGDSVSRMVIHRDITEMKRLEQQLLQAQKMESLGTLTGGIAHDFNNILTAILGYSEEIMENLEEGSKLWLDTLEIRKASELAASLTGQLLTFSRNQKIVPKVVNFNHILLEMGSVLGRILGEDIKIKTELDVNAGKILADPGQLNQIVVNLAVNSRDALADIAENMEKVIKIVTSEVDLDATFTRLHEGSSPGPHLLIEFTDNGCGMPAEVTEHIFEPFFTTKEPGQGTGMGLASVYGIVKQNGANIYVNSQPGIGTTFKIYWPITGDNESGRAEAKKIAPAVKATETILFVEDDDRIRDLIARKFQQQGYKMIVAANGRAALEKAKAHTGPIDLLFTDVIMPIMSGKELADAIVEFYPEIKIIFVSGYLDDRISKEILTQANFVEKPFSFKKINQLIRQLLDD